MDRFEIRYNSRAKIWIDNGIDFFRGVSFYIDNLGNKAEAVSKTSGNYYPVRDSCKKDGDPEEGCLTTDALYYRGEIPTPSSSYAHVVILGSSNETIVDGKYETSQVKTYSPSQLGCQKDTSKCRSKCSDKGGTWDSWNQRCTVYWYLSNFCYRVNKVNNRWQLDLPAY